MSSPSAEQAPIVPPQVTKSRDSRSSFCLSSSKLSLQTLLNSYVGFDTITQQIEKKLLKKGFQFNVMVVGQSGLGKSTLVNTIFASHLIDSKGRLEASESTRQTTEIEAVAHSK